jgi:spermidine synthase
MNRARSRLLAIESPFPDAHSMLRLLEPPGSSHETLCNRLFEGSYDKPFIVDSGRRRFLHFDLDCVQSAMYLEDPNRLCLAYTRKMMTFLLFNSAPQRILLLGLGGGSLAKFCYESLPGATLIAVEPNLDVIALREEFLIPADDRRFRVVHADGADYVARLPPGEDVILADACDRTGVAPELDAVEFYQNAHRCLSPGGVFVINVCGERHSRSAHLLKIRNAFDDEFLTLQVELNRNLIVLAFKEPRKDASRSQLEGTLADLKRQFRLDFSKYMRLIELDGRSRRWQRLFS